MINTEYTPVKTIANGVTTEFSFTWQALTDAAVKVFFEDEDGVITAITTGITINRTAGTVTFDVAPDDGFVIIARETSNTQNTIYKTSSGFQADVVETDFDRRTLVSQESEERLARSIVYPIGTEGVENEIPAPQIGKAIKGNAIGTGWVYTDNDPDEQAALATAQAVIATTQADNASTSATNASTSATNALASANKAERWAEEDEDVEVEAGKYSAKHWSAKAEASAGSIDTTNLVPTGAVLSYAGATAPTGFLISDGSAISRSEYSGLFTAIGTTFGVGDGTTTFNIPDMRGRVPVGVLGGDSNFGSLNSSGGAKTHTLTTGEMPNHRHEITVRRSSDSPWAGIGGAQHNTGSTYTGYTARTGGGQAHNNLQPYRVLNFIIKF